MTLFTLGQFTELNHQGHDLFEQYICLLSISHTCSTVKKTGFHSQELLKEESGNIS